MNIDISVPSNAEVRSRTTSKGKNLSVLNWSTDKEVFEILSFGGEESLSALRGKKHSLPLSSFKTEWALGRRWGHATFFLG